MTNENILLEGDFLFFDSNASPSNGENSKWWSKETPREVKVTFEKLPSLMYNGSPSFCLRMKDLTKEHKAVFYYQYLDRSSFCGTECGRLDMIRTSLLCLKSKLSYKFLAVFLISDTEPYKKSCVILRTKWAKDDQARWQNTIEEHLGARQKWSVIETGSEPERAILCLTNSGLALNKPSFSDTSFPSCVWHHTFRDFKISTNYNDETEILEIIAIEKGKDEMCRYELKTSRGQEITEALQVQRPILTLSATKSNPLQEDSDAPAPCRLTPNMFVRTPTRPDTEISLLSRQPAPDLPPSPSLAPPPPPERPPRPRRHSRPTNAFQHLKPLRRSFSMGEKELLVRSKSRKHLLRGKISISGGYDSDSDDVYQLPLTDNETMKAADRGTLYMHKKWYQSFKSAAEDSNTPVPSSAVRESMTALLRSFSIGKPLRDSTDHRSRISEISIEDDYWTREVSFTLQNILDEKRPFPDTMKLDWKQRTRLNFNLYPSGPGLAAGWQELGDFIGLLNHEIGMVEHFCMVHRKSPVNVLLDHWQFVYNKQTKQEDKNPPSQEDCPPCTKSQLIMFLQDKGRLDILEICNLV